MLLLLLSNVIHSDVVVNSKNAILMGQLCRENVKDFSSGRTWENFRHRNRARSKVILQLIDSVMESISDSLFVNNFTTATG